jgi:hypothetical protein
MNEYNMVGKYWTIWLFKFMPRSKKKKKKLLKIIFNRYVGNRSK